MQHSFALHGYALPLLRLQSTSTEEAGQSRRIWPTVLVKPGRDWTIFRTSQQKTKSFSGAREFLVGTLVCIGRQISCTSPASMTNRQMKKRLRCRSIQILFIQDLRTHALACAGAVWNPASLGLVAVRSMVRTEGTVREQHQCPVVKALRTHHSPQEQRILSLFKTTGQENCTLNASMRKCKPFQYIINTPAATTVMENALIYLKFYHSLSKILLRKCPYSSIEHHHEAFARSAGNLQGGRFHAVDVTGTMYRS